MPLMNIVNTATNEPVDHTEINGVSKKVNLGSVITQDTIGDAVTFTSSSAISIGQPVIYNYASGIVTAITAGSLPSQHEIIGIALETVNSGETVSILTKGFATARRDSTFQSSSETVLLNNTTNGTTRNLTNATTFLDSGNISSSYGSSQNYSITFDAQAGKTTKITVTDFEFEHATYSMYDRLGIQGSNNGVSFSNLSVEWLHRSATSTPTYSNSFAGSSWNSNSSDEGYILPKDTVRAILMGGVPNNSFPADIDTGYRYIKFYFISDGSVNKAGWNMTLAPNTPYSTNAETVAEGTTLYLDNSDYTKLTTDDTSQIVVGYCAYNNGENDSIFIRV